MIHVCQNAFEPFLAKELNSPALAKGPGWVRAAGTPPGELCFAHYSLQDETELKGPSARPLAKALLDYFLQTSKEERYDAPWPLMIEGEPSKRANTVAELFIELAKKTVSRVAKLAKPGRPRRGPSRGLFAYLTTLDTLYVSREAVFGGQRRMADDPQAPSRSYLKAEEAYLILGTAPAPGETVIDLGAAPGGWSYSAAKRGARVTALDNGPLKGGALNNPLIKHRAEDAFKFPPVRTDWLFCDMVEDPDRVLALVDRWTSKGLCRRFVINLKFGRIDPLPLIRRARTLCRDMSIRHLYHDREEITLTGSC